MKRTLPQEEIQAQQHYLLPTKNLKLSLKAHPQNTLQVLQDENIVIVNSGFKILIFDLLNGLLNGDSGLKECHSSAEIIKNCSNKLKSMYMRQYLQSYKQEYYSGGMGLISQAQVQHPKYLQNIIDSSGVQGQNSDADQAPLIKKFIVFRDRKKIQKQANIEDIFYSQNSSILNEKGYCILLQNGQCVLDLGNQDQIYLNDEIWNPKYQDLVIFEVKSESFTMKLSQHLLSIITSTLNNKNQAIFLPFNTLSLKTHNSQTLTLASHNSHLFYFLERELIFAMQFQSEIIHTKIKKIYNNQLVNYENSVKNCILVVEKEGFVNQIQLNFDGKMQISSVLRVQIDEFKYRQNLFDSIYLADGQWLLAADNCVYFISFNEKQPKKSVTRLIYRTKSILSPIVQINKIIASKNKFNIDDLNDNNDKNDNIVIHLITHDNQNHYLKFNSKAQSLTLAVPIIKSHLNNLAINCYGQIQVSSLGLIQIGIGSANQSSGDPKCTLYSYIPQAYIDTQIQVHKLISEKSSSQSEIVHSMLHNLLNSLQLKTNSSMKENIGNRNSSDLEVDNQLQNLDKKKMKIQQLTQRLKLSIFDILYAIDIGLVQFKQVLQTLMRNVLSYISENVKNLQIFNLKQQQQIIQMNQDLGNYIKTQNISIDKANNMELLKYESSDFITAILSVKILIQLLKVRFVEEQYKNNEQMLSLNEILTQFLLHQQYQANNDLSLQTKLEFIRDQQLYPFSNYNHPSIIQQDLLYEQQIKMLPDGNPFMSCPICFPKQTSDNINHNSNIMKSDPDITMIDTNLNNTSSVLQDETDLFYGQSIHSLQTQLLQGHVDCEISKQNSYNMLENQMDMNNGNSNRSAVVQHRYVIDYEHLKVIINPIDVTRCKGCQNIVSNQKLLCYLCNYQN
eukprot:403349787